MVVAGAGKEFSLVAVVVAEKEGPSQVYRPLLLLPPRTLGRLNVAGGEILCVVRPSTW